MDLNQQDIELILSALSNDKVGTWGDGRQEKLDALIAKVRASK
jgi:hypothetical protein